MDPHRAAVLLQYADRLAPLGKGARGPIIQAACQELAVSRQTFYRLLAEVRPSGRKRRSGSNDASALTREEALKISSYVMESVNRIDKQGRTLREAVRVLRSNGEIVAGRVDPDTGEIAYLSMSAISRALKAYVMHPEQVRQPTPHARVASLYPNHVHQVDTSIGTIYYLQDGTALVEWDQGVHYKNKPWNIETAARHRVIRYVLVDHTTGLTRFRYYPGSENPRNTVDFLAWCWSQSENDPADPFHGLPVMLYVDNGIAKTLVRCFCERLTVEVQTHKPRNSRATGSVEGAHNYAVEMPFEHGLRDRLQHINSFEALNRAAYRWQLWWNATETHGRLHMTRHAAWMHIRPERLRTTAPYPALLELATERPKRCRVNGDLTAKFRGRTWSVKEVPGVLVKGEVWLHWHPFIADTAMAVVTEADGQERHIALRDVTGVVDPAQEQWGFPEGAAVWGESYKAPPETAADRHRKQARLLASGASTLEEDAKRRKRKDFVAFGGALNPYREAEEANLPPVLRPRGQAATVTAPVVELPPVTAFQAARLLRDRLGRDWRAEYLQELTRRYGDAVPEAELETLEADFRARAAAPPRPALALVR